MGRNQPTYIGVIIHLLSTMDIPLVFQAILQSYLLRSEFGPPKDFQKGGVNGGHFTLILKFGVWKTRAKNNFCLTMLNANFHEPLDI